MLAANIALGLRAPVKTRRCTNVIPVPPPHIIHLTALDPSALTDAVSPDDAHRSAAEHDQEQAPHEIPAQGFALRGLSENISKNKRNHSAADSCVPDVYVSCSRLTNEQTAISLNWD